mmetsp:Transcript_141400/g.249815  ORF Transcript_141400/g.249815 Transcript_141400/m.249815 type:complete len:215 (-) Transcript_141400:2-646(-)
MLFLEACQHLRPLVVKCSRLQLHRKLRGIVWLHSKVLQVARRHHALNDRCCHSHSRNAGSEWHIGNNKLPNTCLVEILHQVPNCISLGLARQMFHEVCTQALHEIISSCVYHSQGMWVDLSCCSAGRLWRDQQASELIHQLIAAGSWHCKVQGPNAKAVSELHRPSFRDQRVRCPRVSKDQHLRQLCCLGHSSTTESRKGEFELLLELELEPST